MNGPLDTAMWTLRELTLEAVAQRQERGRGPEKQDAEKRVRLLPASPPDDPDPFAVNWGCLIPPLIIDP